MYLAKLFTGDESLVVGSHDGDEYYYTDENYDEWNNNNQDQSDEWNNNNQDQSDEYNSD